MAPELVKKMNNAVLLNTNCEEVKKQITDIGTAASDDEFEDFTKRYEQAYKFYRLFVNSYSGICDISDLISNRQHWMKQPTVWKCLKVFDRLKRRKML